MSEQGKPAVPETSPPFPTTRQASTFVSVTFAVIAILALWYYVMTPSIPPTYELHQITQYREVGGNGMKLFGLFALAVGAGLCSMLGMVAMMSIDSSERYDRRYR